MEDLIAAAKALLTYIERDNVYDTMDDDGGGHIDCSQSYELKSRTADLQHAIENVSDTLAAMKLIKKCFIESVQTAIAKQLQ